MNELDVWTRKRDRERELRQIDASAWQRTAAAGTSGKSGRQRSVSAWLMGPVAWIAGAAGRSPSSHPEADRTVSLGPMSK